MGSFSSVLFNPAIVNSLHSLTGEGAASLLVRDGLQNYGIVNESKKENKNLGDEISLIMWGSWAIWGGGSFLLKNLYYKALHPVLPMAKNADSGIMESPDQVQRLTKEKATAYAQSLKQRFAGDASLAHQAEKLAQDYLKIAQKDASTYASHIKKAQLAGILFSGAIPAFLTGYVLPKMAQAHSKKKLSREAIQRAKATQTEKASSPSLAEQWKQAKALELQDAQALPTDSNNETKTASLAKPRSAFSGAINYFNQNPNMTNLVLVDSTVTASRVLTAEDNNDKIRWATYEAIFLYMMYLGSAQVRDMVQQGTMELPSLKEHAQLKKLNLKSLAILNHYAKPEKGKPHLAQAFQNALREFGVDETKLKEMKQAFETFTVHHHLLNKEEKETAKAHLSKVMNPILGQISEHMQKNPKAYKTHDNVIIDLLISEGVMPVHHENGFSALKNGRLFDPQVLGIDLTQAIPAFDEGHGEKGLSNLMYRLEQLSRAEKTEIGHQLKASYIGHSMGIVASLLGGFLVMGRLSPLVQSWLSHKVTGQELPNRLDINNYEPEVHKYKPTVLDAHV